MKILTDADIYTNLIPGHAGRGRGYPITFIVVHIQQGLGDLFSYFSNQELDSTMWNPRQGKVERLLNDSDTPWTNGAFSNLNKQNPAIMNLVNKYNPTVDPNGINSNPFSVTVENEGFPNDIMNPDQYARLVGLIAYWCKKHNIPVDRNHIIGHGEIGEHAYCPGAIVERNWDKIITDVKNLLEVKMYNPNPDNKIVSSNLTVATVITNKLVEKKDILRTNMDIFTGAGSTMIIGYGDNYLYVYDPATNVCNAYSKF